MQKEQLSVFVILRAIRAGRCRERRYADHIFIQIYFRMHHFVVKFSKFSSLQAARGHWPPNQNLADVHGSKVVPVLEILKQVFIIVHTKWYPHLSLHTGKISQLGDSANSDFFKIINILTNAWDATFPPKIRTNNTKRNSILNAKSFSIFLLRTWPHLVSRLPNTNVHKIYIIKFSLI